MLLKEVRFCFLHCYSGIACNKPALSDVRKGTNQIPNPVSYFLLNAFTLIWVRFFLWMCHGTIDSPMHRQYVKEFPSLRVSAQNDNIKLDRLSR